MSQSLQEAYQYSLKIVNLLPEHLKNVKAIKNPEKYIYIAKDSNEFLTFYRDSLMESFIQEEIDNNLSTDILDILGIEDKENYLDNVLEKIKSQEKKKYIKKAEKHINEIYNNNLDLAKQTTGGVYNLFTGYICLNPFCEKNDKNLNAKDFYIWTIIHELAHAIHIEVYKEKDSVLNKFLTLYWLSFFLPNKIFLKGMDIYQIKELLKKQLVSIQRSDEDSSTNKFIRNDLLGMKVNDLKTIINIKMEDNIPTRYAGSAPQELWAESFALFTISNKDAKLLMPNMYDFICKEILQEGDLK